MEFSSLVKAYCRSKPYYLFASNMPVDQKLKVNLCCPPVPLTKDIALLPTRVYAIQLTL